MEKRVKSQKHALLGKKIYEALKGEILSLELRAGQVISEEALAERYGTSRTPVREVLTTLGKEGFLQYYPHKGYLVTEFKLDDVLEVFQIRMLLEPEAAFMAARRATTKDIESLEKIAQEIADSPVSGEANLRFHKKIADLSGNKLMADLIENLNEKIWLFAKGYLASIDPKKNAVDHFKIVRALQRGEPEKSHAAMREHLKTTQQSISFATYFIEAKK